MRWINYHHLIYFKEIATQGSISKASETLKVGQSALSSQLKNLEEYLGVKLFERKNRRLYLTEPGKVTLEYANKINDLGQELISIIEDKVFTKEVKLTVGALDSIPKNLICDIVEYAHKKTNCFLSILEGDIDSLLRQLLAHQIEIFISDHQINSFEHENIFTKPIVQSPLFAFAPEKLKSLKNNFPLSLDGAPVILPTKHSKIRQDVEHFFHTFNINANIIAETQDTALQKILSSRGDGVIFLPDFTTTELVAEKKLYNIGILDQVYVEYYMTYSKRIIDNPALELLTSQDFNGMREG